MKIMVDISNIAGLFEDTIYYIIISVSTIFFIFIFGLYIKNKNIYKEKSESFKIKILNCFVDNYVEELNEVEIQQRDRFFDKVISYQNKPMDKNSIDEISEILEHFSKEFLDRRNTHEYLADFKDKM
ncbi:MAG: hypothetical protein MIO93_06190 [ANME-2 cluster archaeon]|nr:hypothetical protein [ANME-2 cluster archaeon]